MVIIENSIVERFRAMKRQLHIMVDYNLLDADKKEKAITFLEKYSDNNLKTGSIK